MAALQIDPAATLLAKRGIRRGIMTLRRERGWGTSLWALLGVVLIAQVFLVIWIGVHSIDTLLRTQTDLRLQVQPSATDRQVQELLIAVRALPYVSSVDFITREKALEREKTANPDLVRFLEQFNIQNPFPDTVSVTLKNLADYQTFSAFIKQPDWHTTIDPSFLSQATDQEQQVEQMLRLTDAGRAVAFLFFALAGAILLFVVVELVRRRAFLRREEVFVERMSGAQEASVILPFATEAVLLLLGAVVLSVACLEIFLFALPVLVPALGDGGTFGPLRDEIGSLLMTYGPLIVFLEILCAPLLALAGAYLGTRGERSALA